MLLGFYVVCNCQYVNQLLMCFAGAAPYEICSQDVDLSELNYVSSDLDYYCNYPYLPASGSEGMVYWWNNVSTFWLYSVLLYQLVF